MSLLELVHLNPELFSQRMQVELYNITNNEENAKRVESFLTNLDTTSQITKTPSNLSKLKKTYGLLTINILNAPRLLITGETKRQQNLIDNIKQCDLPELLVALLTAEAHGINLAPLDALVQAASLEDSSPSLLLFNPGVRYLLKPVGLAYASRVMEEDEKRKEFNKMEEDEERKELNKDVLVAIQAAAPLISQLNWQPNDIDIKQAREAFLKDFRSTLLVLPDSTKKQYTKQVIQFIEKPSIPVTTKLLAENVNKWHSNITQVAQKEIKNPLLRFLSKHIPFIKNFILNRRKQKELKELTSSIQKIADTIILKNNIEQKETSSNKLTL